jgi:DNA-binding XRE family transcriptional regulator
MDKNWTVYMAHETRHTDFKPTQRNGKLSKTAVPWRQVFSNYSDAMITGISLRESRKLLELTQHQLSQRTGISQRQISALENGKQLMTEAMAKKFAEVLQVDYRVFL